MRTGGTHISGFRLTDRSPKLSEEEMDWLTFLRELHNGTVRRPTLVAVQALRIALDGAA